MWKIVLRSRRNRPAERWTDRRDEDYEAMLVERRYIVCHNHLEVKRDAADGAQWSSLCQREAVESTLGQI